MGKCEKLSEKLMDTVTAVSGSSPAYVFMFIEAMADGAVQGGMTRDSAYKFAAQAVLGSAKMVLETGMHPGALKDMVCSPAGTTILCLTTLYSDNCWSNINPENYFDEKDMLAARLIANFESATGIQDAEVLP